LLSIYEKFNSDPTWLLTGKEPEADFMCDWSPEVIAACRTVKEIFDSGDEVIVPALLGSLPAMKEAVDRKKKGDKKKDKRIKDLEGDVKRLRKLLEQDFDGAAGAEDGSRLKKKLM